MRSVLFLPLMAAALWAAPKLEIVKPALSQMEGGVPDPAEFEYSAGQTIFVSCRVTGFEKDANGHIRIGYSVQEFDPQGVPLDEVYSNTISEQLLPQDKEWLPKIATAFTLPPLVRPGKYRIVIKAEDLNAKTSAELPVAFRVRGRDVPPNDSVVVRNFRFYQREDDASAMIGEPKFHNGGELWARFDITGFKYGPGNKIDVSYTVSVLGSDDKTLWKQAEPAVAQSESFYPKPFIPASMSLSLQKVRPGTYTLSVQVTDAIGNASSEARQKFSVE